MGAEPARGHLPLEEGDRSLEHGTERRAELASHPPPALEGLATDQAHEFRAFREEAEPRREHTVNLLPAVVRPVGRLGHPGEPVGEGSFEHLAVQSLFGGEVMQQARAPDPDELGDVVERGPLEAVLGETPQGGVQDRLARRDARPASEVGRKRRGGLPSGRATPRGSAGLFIHRAYLPDGRG